MAQTVIPIPVSTVTEAAEPPSLTYALDLDTGRIIGKVDGLAAVNQAIRKAIITPRFKCLIYDNRYGSEIKDAIIAQDATRELIEATIPRFVKDALKPDTRVLKVYDFSFDIRRDKARIRFKADTIYGDTVFEEVV
jgi:hypothetical protein